MPKLDITRTYEDNKSPVQADLDNIVDDVEILVNTTKLDDDNFTVGGITASTKVLAGSVTTGTIRNNSVTATVIANASVSTEKIADSAVTNDKLAATSITEPKANPLSGKLPAGAVMYLHTYNGTVSVPRGWMTCDGSVINETNYEAEHGPGTWTTDDVSSGTLGTGAVYLPDMTGNYAVGVSSTTKDGSSTITTVGNASHQVDFSHTHTDTHSHKMNDPAAPQMSDVIALSYTANQDPAGFVAVDNQPQATYAPPMEIHTASGDHVTTSKLTTSSVQPESVEMITIMKVI